MSRLASDSGQELVVRPPRHWPASVATSHAPNTHGKLSGRTSSALKMPALEPAQMRPRAAADLGRRNDLAASRNQRPSRRSFYRANIRAHHINIAGAAHQRVGARGQTFQARGLSDCVPCLGCRNKWGSLVKRLFRSGPLEET
jgi:hypothetical protein